MARRPEFDRAEVVRRAMRAFWTHGFQGASMRTLASATGLLPGSLYAAFGSKAGLFAEALAAYVAEVRASVGRADGGPAEHIAAWFAELVDRALDVSPGEPGRGCLLLHAAAELPALEASGVEAVRTELEALIQQMARWVASAREGAPRPDAPSPHDTAALLVAALAGISALSRSGADRRTLESAAQAALRLV